MNRRDHLPHGLYKLLYKAAHHANLIIAARFDLHRKIAVGHCCDNLDELFHRTNYHVYHTLYQHSQQQNGQQTDHQHHIADTVNI